MAVSGQQDAGVAAAAEVQEGGGRVAGAGRRAALESSGCGDNGRRGLKTPGVTDTVPAGWQVAP